MSVILTVVLLIALIWVIKLITLVGKRTATLGAIIPIGLIFLYCIAPSTVQQSITESFSSIFLIDLMRDYASVRGL